MTQNSNNGSNGPKSIANVVGKHADQVMDGLFSEIEEMLSGDLQEKSPERFSTSAKVKQAQSPMEQLQRSTPSSHVSGGPVQSVALPPAQPIVPPAARPWTRWLAIGGGLVVVCGGGLWWLQSQGKINLAALARGESPISLSNSADVKFSEYLRNSITKIDNTAPVGGPGAQISIPNPPTASTVEASPAATVEATLVKIVPGNPPLVEFAIGGQVQQFKGGDQIGNSGWIVTNVINTVDNEVILKRNGESRSLKLNDKL